MGISYAIFRWTSGFLIDDPCTEQRVSARPLYVSYAATETSRRVRSVTVIIVGSRECNRSVAYRPHFLVELASPKSNTRLDPLSSSRLAASQAQAGAQDGWHSPSAGFEAAQVGVNRTADR